MIALSSFFIIIIISLIIVRVAAAMLQLTDVSSDTARFQTRFAFTGVGYITREAEIIANHPVRRKIIASLMFIYLITRMKYFDRILGKIIGALRGAGPRFTPGITKVFSIWPEISKR